MIEECSITEHPLRETRAFNEIKVAMYFELMDFTSLTLMDKKIRDSIILLIHKSSYLCDMRKM